MPDYEIGKLKGRYVVYWFENLGGHKHRRRFRLSASNKAEAWIEAERRYNSQLTLKGDELTLGDIWGKYVSYLGKRTTAGHLVNLWKTVGPVLGKHHPTKLDDEDISKYLSIRKKAFFKKNGRHASVTTLHHEVNLIQSVLNYGYRKNLCGKPIKLQKLRAKKRSNVWLKEEEIFKFFAESSKTPYLHIAVALMLATAGRVSAVLELTWDRVDFSERTIDLRVVASEEDLDTNDDAEEDQGKADQKDVGYRKSRAFVPMNDGLYNLLVEWRKSCDSEHVVEYQGRSVQSVYISFKKAAKRAGLPDLSPHHLRHTSAVHMAANGCEMSRISLYLGHSSVRVTESIYARFSPEHLREESTSVDFFNRWKNQSTTAD